MLRLVDDYLYITTDLAKAKGFLDTMIKGTQVLSKNQPNDI
jgi:hypothetical protein